MKRLSDEVMERLYHYSWPGNVRELENLIERMVILATGEVLNIEDLPERFQQKGYIAKEIFEIPERASLYPVHKQ